MLVKDHGIFDASEHIPAFIAWRRGACADAASLERCPGHILDASGLAELIALFQFGLLYAWDIVAATRWRAIAFDHDEHLFVSAANAGEWASLLHAQ